MLVTSLFISSLFWQNPPNTKKLFLQKTHFSQSLKVWLYNRDKKQTKIDLTTRWVLPLERFRYSESTDVNNLAVSEFCLNSDDMLFFSVDKHSNGIVLGRWKVYFHGFIMLYYKKYILGMPFFPKFSYFQLNVLIH